MPSYSFKCPECDHEESVIRKISDEFEQLCSKCEAVTVRNIKTSGFSISGEGVYKQGFSGYSNPKRSKKNRYTGD